MRFSTIVLGASGYLRWAQGDLFSEPGLARLLPRRAVGGTRVRPGTLLRQERTFRQVGERLKRIQKQHAIR
jgi:hypothetical protein